jgi:hypothetical protein
MRRNKFGAVRTTVDGISFHSKGEARRYCQLKLLEAAGEIEELTLQPKFPLHGKSGKKICSYIADFQYLERGKKAWTVEDFKGAKTAIYNLKKKIFLDEYPQFLFLETTRA